MTQVQLYFLLFGPQQRIEEMLQPLCEFCWIEVGWVSLDLPFIHANSLNKRKSRKLQLKTTNKHYPNVFWNHVPVLITATEHPLQCKVCKGDDIWQEDHCIYAGGTLIMSSCWLLRLSLSLMARILLHHHYGRGVQQQWGLDTWIHGVHEVYPLVACSQRFAEEGIMRGKPCQQMRSCRYHFLFKKEVDL